MNVPMLPAPIISSSPWPAHQANVELIGYSTEYTLVIEHQFSRGIPCGIPRGISERISLAISKRVRVADQSVMWAPCKGGDNY